jgi:hypothetical protein
MLTPPSNKRLAPVLETKHAALAVKSAPDGTFSGYASLFGTPDLTNDVVAPGAFARSLEKRGTRGIKLLFQHDAAEPIGLWLDIREDRRGLFVHGHLVHEIARAREVHALMRAGALDGLSIGFRTVKSRRDAHSGLRRLLEIDLWEISIVTFPMHPGARIGTLESAPIAAPALRAVASDRAGQALAAMHAAAARIRAGTTA